MSIVKTRRKGNQIATSCRQKLIAVH